MKNEFQLFDKENILLRYLFEEIDKVILANRKVKSRYLKILSCYFGAEKFQNNEGLETTILKEVRKECKKRGIFLELILSKNIYNQNQDILNGSKYFKAYPNSRDAFFHGKAIAYIQGSQKIKENIDGITDVKIISGDGLLLVTSANFSNAYIGNNIETGVLLKTKKTLESYLLEFEKSKGIKNKIVSVSNYNSLYDVLSNGFMLFKDENSTLNNISTIHLPLKKNLESNDAVNRIGGVLSDGNLSISIGKAGYFNIDEFEKSFPKPKNIFSKYSIDTPFGLWINKEVYFEILKLYSPLLNIYQQELRSSFTNTTIDEIALLIEGNLIKSEDVMALLQNNKDEIKVKIDYWKTGFNDNIGDDEIISLMFYGYEAIEFPLDPNYTSTLKQFVNFTKKINYKKEKAKNPTENIKNILRPFIESESKDFKNLEEKLNFIKEKINLDFKEKKKHTIHLKCNISKATNSV